MNWEAISAIGEVVGALAVVVTLIFLAVQIRHSSRSLDESNRLERAIALDRHADSISRWRGRLMENEDLARIWLIASRDGELSDTEKFRINNLWIDLANLQRSNFVRSKIVGEDGLAQVSVRSLAAEIFQSVIFQQEWDTAKPWMELASSDFVTQVDDAIKNLAENGEDQYRARYHR